MKEDGMLSNGCGCVSGAKIILMMSCLLATAFVVRDLVLDRELTEYTTGLIGLLLLVGLVNRMSARGSFRIRVHSMEVESNNHPEEGRGHQGGGSYY